MVTHRNGQPGDEPDREDDHALGCALGHSNRVHVTLDNLADLAGFNAPAVPTVDPFADSTDRVGVPDNGVPDNGGQPANGRSDTSRSNSRVVPAPWSLPATYAEDPPLLERRRARRARRQANGAPAGTPSPLLPALRPPGTVAPRPGWVVPAVRQRPLALPAVLAAEATVAEAPVARPTPVRAGWARPAERWLLELLAVALASMALIAPSILLILTAVVCVVGATYSFVSSGNPLATLPRRALGRAVTLLHPRSSLWVPVLLARTVIVAVLLPAAVAAADWIIDRGTGGAMAAARAGAWADGFRVAVALACIMLITSVGDGRHRRAGALRRWAAPATDGTLVTLALTSCAVVALVVMAAPRPSDPIASRADGLGLLPPGARTYADRVRDDIVTSELDAVASCLSHRSGTTWSTSYTNQNPAGAADVARLTARREPTRVPPADLATAIMAAHNQLAPWVEAIEVAWPGGDLVHTERASLPRRQPLTDGSLLVAATTVGGQWLSGGSADVSLALRCSAGPVL